MLGTVFDAVLDVDCELQRLDKLAAGEGADASAQRRRVRLVSQGIGDVNLTDVATAHASKGT